MSFSLNKTFLLGRLGRDPEVRYTSGGKAVANFTLATDESYKDSSGETQKKTEWHNCVVWGNNVIEKFVAPYLHKGDLVLLEGKIQSRQWEDREGQKRTTVEINVSDIKKAPGGSDSSKTAQAQQSDTDEVSDESIPF